MKKYFTILNFSNLILLLIAIISLFLAYKYEPYLNIDFTPLSIAIIFALVYNIHGQFEYPFDNTHVDDFILNIFKIER